MNKYLVITSINSPSMAVRAYLKHRDWKVIVVGDKKTPSDWKMQNVVYLSPSDQTKMKFSITRNLEWNNYSRKMLGYLYAMQNGADIIADSDDDNYPLDNWGKIPDMKNVNIIDNCRFVNMYSIYTNRNIWPRGFPLEEINKPCDYRLVKKTNISVEIWQFLVNKEPDVDAIYRLTNNSKVSFNRNGFYVLGENTTCPFNSQNTIFTKEAFLLMYLPFTVSMRATDIFRSLIAQPIMWRAKMHLGFGEATAYQKRNQHDYMKDFIDEIPVYINSSKIVEVVNNQKWQSENIDSNLINSYSLLAKKQIIKIKEIDALKSWIRDVLRFL